VLNTGRRYDASKEIGFVGAALAGSRRHSPGFFDRRQDGGGSLPNMRIHDPKPA
jgi:hypothetical protein